MLKALSKNKRDGNIKTWDHQESFAHVAVVHEGKKTKTCDQCNKLFSTNQRLNSHIASWGQKRREKIQVYTLWLCCIYSKSQFEKTF